MYGGEHVIANYSFRNYDGILKVVALPWHECHFQVGSESEFTVLCREAFAEYLAFLYALAFADERLYYRLENGTMLLVEPDSKKYVERGRFRQPDRSGSPAWTHPVIANGKLYLRDQDVLLCYDIKAK